jgi:recombination protein RecA
MPALAHLDHLEALLRARKLDVTLTSANPLADGGRSSSSGKPSSGKKGKRPTGSMGLDWLDRQAAGGWPRGELSEIVGPASSGRTAVLCATLAAATRRGEIVALIDTLDRFDPPSAAAAGIELSHLLWARVPDADKPRTPRLDLAVKAFSLVLQSGGFGVVALDLADVPARAIARLPFTTWMRLQRHVEGSDTLALIVASEPVSRSARGLSLRLGLDARATPVWAGESDRARVLSGVTLTSQVVASRQLGGS